MLSLTSTRNVRAAFALSVALSVMVEPVVGSDALAAISSNPTDPVGDQLRDQLNAVMNTPVDFCDPKTVKAHFMAIGTATIKLTQHQLANHDPGPDDIQSDIDKTVQDAKADGDLVEDLPYVDDYENAETRGDKKAQNDYLKKMTPAAQAQVAGHDQNYTLAAKILTPLADAGDANAQVRLADIYSMGTSAFSPKDLPALPAKVLALLPKHPPILAPDDNLPLAFKYLQLAAAHGSVLGQWGLARAYACGFGTDKNLVLAYMWFSLGLAQRGVITEMSGVTLPMKGNQKDRALDRDFIAAQMKSEEIEQAKQLLTQCFKSGYKDCD
jgi:hypothetical protein